MLDGVELVLVLPMYFRMSLFLSSMGPSDTLPGQICANLPLFRVLWGFCLSNPLWLKLFVLWPLPGGKKKKNPGRDGSFRDIYLQHFLSEVYPYMNSMGKPLTVTLKKKKSCLNGILSFSMCNMEQLGYLEAV